MSVPQIPAALTWINKSSAPIVGSSSLTTSVLNGSTILAAFISLSFLIFKLPPAHFCGIVAEAVRSGTHKAFLSLPHSRFFKGPPISSSKSLPDGLLSISAGAGTIANMKAKSHFLILTILLLGIAWYFASSLTFLLSDTGLRFLQIRELIAHDWQSFAIEYPGRPFDPDLLHTPYNYAYSLLEGDLYLKITPFLPLIASWFYAAIGPVGLSLVPLLGTLITAVTVYQLACLTELPHPKWLLWLTVVATPLFFYTFELWDHTIAVACAAVAVYGLTRSAIQNNWLPAFLGGIALGIGLGQRQEMYMFAIAIGLATLFALWPRWHTIVALAGGAFVGVLPLWWLQYQWVGHPLGMALASNLLGYARPPYYSFNPEAITYSRAITLGRFLFYIQSRAALPFIAVLLVLLGIVTIIFCLRVDKWRKPRNLYAGFILCSLGYGIYAILAVQSTILSGFITTMPLVALSLAYVSRDVDHGRYRIIYKLNLVIALFYFSGMMIITPVDGGLQWGSRYLLPMVPSLLYAAAYTFNTYNLLLTGRMQQALQYTTIGLIAISILIQLSGLVAQIDEHKQAKQLQDAITALPANVILTNAPFMPTHIAGVDDKIFLYVETEEDIAKLITRLDTAGISQLGFITLEAIPLPIPEQVDDIQLEQIDKFIYKLKR